MKKLVDIQQKLKAPKGQMNKFGGYKYRSCEDILEAVKPLLGDAVLLLNDELVNIGDRYYIKATARFIDWDTEISVDAYAREEESKKGMDGSQITGTSSSYARKYALNGLFLIDDTKDSDATNTHWTEDKAKEKPVRERIYSYKKKVETAENAEDVEKLLKHANTLELNDKQKELVKSIADEKIAELTFETK